MKTHKLIYLFIILIGCNHKDEKHNSLPLVNNNVDTVKTLTLDADTSFTKLDTATRIDNVYIPRDIKECFIELDNLLSK